LEEEKDVLVNLCVFLSRTERAEIASIFQMDAIFDSLFLLNYLYHFCTEKKKVRFDNCGGLATFAPLLKVFR
jgi:hypothetical protein